MDASRDAAEDAKRLTADGPRSVDETRRLEAELDRVRQTLQRSEARFRDVIERNADALIVVDQKGVVRFVNRMAMSLFGASREALLGSPFGFPLVAAETTEVDLRANGEARVAEMRVVESEWEGEAAYIASLRDITERKRAEENARALFREQTARTGAEAAAQRFQFLFESGVSLGSSLDYEAILATLAGLCVAGLADWVEVYSIDDAGIVRRREVAHCDESKRALMDQLEKAPIDSASGHPVLEVIRTRKPRLVEVVDDELRDAMAPDPRLRDTIRALGMTSLIMTPMVARDRPLGALSLVSSSAADPFDAQDLALAGDVGARAALAIDNALLYQQAQEANRSKLDLLAVVSHDLRTPLNSIMGYADLLHMGVPEPLPEPARDRLERIRTAARHLLYLLDELLGFARLEAGHVRLHPQEVDLRTVVREAAEVVEPLAHAKHLRFVLELPEQPITLHTDPDKFRQIVLNLAGNALRYTKAGTVRLALGEENHCALTRVSDTGIGIAHQHQERIFDPFWQVDSEQRSAQGGTGLGLSVVKRLVRLLGGEVTVESEPGRGSTFTVALPTRK